jgi:UDP-glucose 4-epimerase
VKNFEKKKCLVFGANGYIGRHLVDGLLKNGCCVKAIDIHSDPSNPNVPYFSMDISCVPAVRSVDWDVDYIFFFAGVTGTFSGFTKYLSLIQVNEIGLLNVLDAIKESMFRPQFVFPSTRLVYKGSEHPLEESAPKDPKTIYAVNKLTSEYLLDAYRNAFDIPYTVFRICVPYGNSIGETYSYGTVGVFLNSVYKNGKISIFGDGSQRRTFTHVDDIVLQIFETCQRKESLNKVFNVIGEDYSLGEVAKLIAEKYGCSLETIIWPENDLRIESGSTVFDSNRLFQLINYRARFAFKPWLDAV